MEKKTYESPSVSVKSIDLLHFICASIQEMNIIIDVDDYDNTGEEVLNFDSDY